MKNLIKWPYVYVLWSADLPTCTKVGFSTNHEKREAQIAASIREQLGRNVTFKKVAFRMPWALSAEKGVQAFLDKALLNTNPVPGTSGHTEWFRCTGIWVAAVLGFTLWYFGVELWSTVAFIAVGLGIIFPLDALFFVGAVWLIQVAGFLTGAFFLLKFLVLLLNLVSIF